jgi:hypothetical protein
MLESLTDDPILLSLHRYWREKRGARRLPVRGDIDPSEIERKVLPHIVLAEYVDAPPAATRIRYRLVGTAMVSYFGSDFTGRFADEVMSGSYLAYIHSLFDDVRRERAAVYSESRFRWDAGGFRWTRRVFMPLGEDVPTQVLVGQTFGGAGDPRTEPFRAPLNDAGGPDQDGHRVILTG